MNGKDFSEVIELIVKDDSRYDKAAYFFIRKALDHTLKGLESKIDSRKSSHVSGQELLEGIRDYSLNQYGPMTLCLINSWGIIKCGDFGNIVFNLVDYGVFGKTDNDNKEDFENCYDFKDAFEKPFLPKNPRSDLLLEIFKDDDSTISNN